MIPLRTPAPIRKFPGVLLTFCLSSFVATFFVWDILWNYFQGRIIEHLVGMLVFPKLLLALICLWYFWIFFPVTQLRAGRSRWCEAGVMALALGMALTGSHYGYNVPTIFVWTTLSLGFAMRDQIWGGVDTLVVGPKLFSVFEVPCYVHVFFFFFYLFIANLAQPLEQFYGKLFYLLALVSFLAGFLIRGAELMILKKRLK